MFESATVAPDNASRCADALAATVTDERQAVARRFAMVAAWADLHCPESKAVRPVAGAFTVGGGEGTPEVTRAAAVELGMLLGVSTGTGVALLRDVLELRHRLPGLWAAVEALEVDGWKARQVAKATHGLTLEQARWVDRQVLEAVVGVPWSRAKDVVEAKVIAANPAAHAARLAEEENRSFVSTRRRSNAAGQRTLIARAPAGGIARMEAMISHLAGLLEASGDTSHLDYRRARAFAMLANPAMACLFLAERQEPNPQLGLEQESSGSSAVELAVVFGQVLKQLGGKAIDRLRPRSVLYLHLAAEAVQGIPGCGVARVEDPLAGGPISTTQLKAWLSTDRVTVKPVIDPTNLAPVDGYEVPVDIREAMRLLTPYETFPYGTSPTMSADLDHTAPYVQIDLGGPPGQTGLRNLGPLSRRHHLAKTFDGFTVHQLAVGLFVWRSPTGHWFRVDHRGTTHLGKDRPSVLDTAERLDPTGMTPLESRLRDLVVRGLAA